MTELDVDLVEQLDKRLGRQKVHDPASRGFPTEVTIDQSLWETKSIRVYDPWPNENQCHGECTGCATCMMLNSVGNRSKGTILGMDDAHRIYSLATRLDPWSGTWPPQDTGSSGLNAAKAAQRLGYGGEYRHVFGGADEVVQLIMEDRVVSIGTWWMSDMLTPNEDGLIEPTGTRVGGHQYVGRGYDADLDLVKIRCWWGSVRDIWIKREHLNDLMMDDGDAHIQDRATTTLA